MQRSAREDAELLDDRRCPSDPGDGLKDLRCGFLKIAHRFNGAGLHAVSCLAACSLLAVDNLGIKKNISVLLLARRLRPGRPHGRRGVNQQSN